MGVKMADSPGETRTEIKQEYAIRAIQEDIKKRNVQNLPVFITGDMNSTFQTRPDSDHNQPHRKYLIYCLLTKDGTISNTYDLAKGSDGQGCPTKSGGPIDHVYASSSVTVTHWANETGGIINRTTDHKSIIIADIQIGGGGSGGIQWPVDKKNWDANKSIFLKPHNGAGTFTSPGTDGVADDIGLSKGTPVYAMVGGKVVKRPLGRASYGCTGNPNVSNNGGLEIESQIQGGTLLVAYAHGDGVTTKQTVQAGEKIMNLGQVGNACGPHLHLDMSFNGKNICPQDVFLALAGGQTPDFAKLTTKASPPCAGRQ
jgi:murein DD-endopeptidase MepM/ murein hydrolase activator NlpD